MDQGEDEEQGQGQGWDMDIEISRNNIYKRTVFPAIKGGEPVEQQPPGVPSRLLRTQTSQYHQSNKKQNNKGQIFYLKILCTNFSFCFLSNHYSKYNIVCKKS